MTPETDARTALLRHTVATVAYRGAKVLRGAPAEFAGFKLNPTTRTPAEILAHVGDLYDWALAMAQGRNDWHDSSPLPWQVAPRYALLPAWRQSAPLRQPPAKMPFDPHLPFKSNHPFQSASPSLRPTTNPQRAGLDTRLCSAGSLVS